jgi:hypothetical protein
MNLRGTVAFSAGRLTGVLSLAIIALACGIVGAAASGTPAAGAVGVEFGIGSVYEPGDLAAGDTVVIARVKGFAADLKEMAVKGAAPRPLLATWEVLKVERGKWEAKEFTFAMENIWSPPPPNARGSRRMAPPYAVGRVFAFSMKTADKTASIVGQERRSFLAPYGRLTASTIQYGGPNKAEYERIMQAVQDFQARQKLPTQGGIQPVEETPDAYVIESVMGDGPDQKEWAFKVEKKTYKVELLP